MYFKYNKSDFKSGIITNLGFTGGYTYQKLRNDGTYARDLNDPVKSVTNKGFYKDTGVLISFFGRANMTFVDKYLLTVTARREAS